MTSNAPSLHPAARTGFDRAAEAYERARPSYPEDAVAWLRERLALRPGRTVVDLAAGTGKLTMLLVPTGARIVAVEPVEGMRSVLRVRAHGSNVSVVAGVAEALPLANGVADAVTVARRSTGSLPPPSPSSTRSSAPAACWPWCGTAATSPIRCGQRSRS